MALGHSHIILCIQCAEVRINKQYIIESVCLIVLSLVVSTAFQSAVDLFTFVSL